MGVGDEQPLASSWTLILGLALVVDSLQIKHFLGLTGPRRDTSWCPTPRKISCFKPSWRVSPSAGQGVGSRDFQGFGAKDAGLWGPKQGPHCGVLLAILCPSLGLTCNALRLQTTK